MSLVYDALLSVGLDDESRWEQINDFFDPSLSEGFGKIDFWPGYKGTESLVFNGTFNYLRVEEFLEHLRRIAFQDPAEVQLFVRRGGTERFEVYNVFDRECTPPQEPDEWALQIQRPIGAGGRAEVTELVKDLPYDFSEGTRARDIVSRFGLKNGLPVHRDDILVRTPNGWKPVPA